MEASHFDDQSAYAAINRLSSTICTPTSIKTTDGGRSWKEIVNGIPDNEVVNSVREDPVRRGLLFAGTERAVYFSLDDGEQWQPLRLNMPATSIRDLVIHDDDIVVRTHGRSFWILDDMTLLRQLNSSVASAPGHLFKPKLTYRFRRNKNTDTPLPPEEPAGKNPPDGAIINYRLMSAARAPVVLDILDGAGRVVRSFQAQIRSSRSSRASTHRRTGFGHRNVCRLRQGRTVSSGSPLSPPKVLAHEYPSRQFRRYPAPPTGTGVLPGVYTVRLTMDSRTYSQPLTVKMDPRVQISEPGLRLQHDIGVRMNEAISRDFAALTQVRERRALLRTQREGAKAGEIADSLAALDSLLLGIESGPSGGTAENLVRLNGELAAVLDIVEGADAEPTTQVVRAAADLERALAAVLSGWSEVQRTRLRRN